MVLLADRHATGGEHEVGDCRPPRQRLAGRVQRIRDDTEVDHLAAEGAQQRRRRELVRVVDLARTERLARHHQLVARAEQRHARPPPHLDLGDSDRGGQPQVRRSEPGAGGNHRLAGLDVLAGTPDVGADLRNLSDHHLVAVAVADLLDHDGVGTRRDQGAGEDARGRAWLERFAGRPAAMRCTTRRRGNSPVRSALRTA